MDLIEENPRKHPAPVPFSEIVTRPSVPEVSLIALDNTDNSSVEKNNSFSGTEFQTYNAWKWKYLTDIDKIGGSPSKEFNNKCKDVDNCFLIRDKYASSKTEKRKNEILYGPIDEPRKPLLPKVFPEIPNCSNLLLSNNSFCDFNSPEDETKKSQKKLEFSRNPKKSENKYLDNHLKKECTSSDKLYHIISEQNKQVEILEQQIKQTLKLQEVKDKQIEQLLKSQELKERKIAKLLQSIEKKEEEMEKLLKLKEKQEEHLKNLFKSQEDKEKENLELFRKLENVNKKKTCSIGTMTDVQMIESSTNTTQNYYFEDFNNENKEDHTCLRNSIETNEFQERDKSLSLNSAELPLIGDQVPTPQSSIHLDIQDFHLSSEESDNETDIVSNKCLSPQVDSNQMGYTFYNNIITQVKDIIQNTGEKESNSCGVTKALRENNFVKERKNSLHSCKTVEVLERDNVPSSGVNLGNNNFVNRFSYEASSVCMKDSYSPSDISLKINSLALKYLKKEQISQYNLQTQITTPMHPDVTIYNVTNLSFGSTRYFDRCGILPNVRKNLQDINLQENVGFPVQSPKRSTKFSPKNPSLEMVLDISGLNQQQN